MVTSLGRGDRKGRVAGQVLRFGRAVWLSVIVQCTLYSLAVPCPVILENLTCVQAKPKGVQCGVVCSSRYKKQTKCPSVGNERENMIHLFHKMFYINKADLPVCSRKNSTLYCWVGSNLRTSHSSHKGIHNAGTPLDRKVSTQTLALCRQTHGIYLWDTC